MPSMAFDCPGCDQKFPAYRPIRQHFDIFPSHAIILDCTVCVSTSASIKSIKQSLTRHLQRHTEPSHIRQQTTSKDTSAQQNKRTPPQAVAPLATKRCFECPSCHYRSSIAEGIQEEPLQKPIQQAPLTSQAPVVQRSPVVQQGSVTQQGPVVKQAAVTQKAHVIQQSPAVQQPPVNQQASALDGLHSCTQCKRRFKTEVAMLSHIEDTLGHTQVPGGPFQCVRCGRLFNRNSGCINHSQNSKACRLGKQGKDSRTVLPTKFGCSGCNKTFPTEESVYDHGRAMHNSQALPQEWYECPDCQSSFKTAEALKTHCRTRGHWAISFGCSRCGSTFGTINALNDHCRDKGHWNS